MIGGEKKCCLNAVTVSIWESHSKPPETYVEFLQNGAVFMRVCVPECRHVATAGPEISREAITHLCSDKPDDPCLSQLPSGRIATPPKTNMCNLFIKQPNVRMCVCARVDNCGCVDACACHRSVLAFLRARKCVHVCGSVLACVSPGLL